MAENVHEFSCFSSAPKPVGRMSRSERRYFSIAPSNIFFSAHHSTAQSSNCCYALNALAVIVYFNLSTGLALGQQQQQQQNDEFQCPQKSGFYPDPIQCDLYYHCTADGELTEKLCPDGLLFDDTNPSHEKCDTSINVECGQRTTQRERKTKKCHNNNGVRLTYANLVLENKHGSQLCRKNN